MKQVFQRKTKSELLSQNKTKSKENGKSFIGNAQNKKIGGLNSVSPDLKKKCSEQNSNNKSQIYNKSFPSDNYHKISNENSKKRMANQELVNWNSLESISILKKDIEDLKSQYNLEINNIYKEQNNLLHQINQTKTELINMLYLQNCSLQNSVKQMDVGFRVLSKVVRTTQEHYSKLVPFVLENIMNLITKQEYLFEQHKRNINSDIHNESFNTSFHNSLSSDSKAFSISISPLAGKDLYKLTFIPIEPINVAKLCEEVKECIATLPEYCESPIGTFSTEMQNCGNFRKPLVESTVLTKCFKNIETIEKNQSLFTENNTRKFQFNSSVLESLNQSSSDLSDEKDLQLLKNISLTNNNFKDLKHRYLCWKFHKFHSNTFPRLKTYGIEEEQLETFESEVFFEKENENEGFNESLCQSETELLGNKFRLYSNNSLVMTCDEDTSFNQTILYQTLPKSLIGEIRKMNNFETTSEKERFSKTSDEFSIVLPRSKLSSLLSNNFKNISPMLILNDETETIQRSEPKYLSKINYQSDYFSPISRNQDLSNIPKASFETLSDSESYMDDDYGQQYLLSQSYGCEDPNSFVNNSFEELYSKLENFILPESSVNNIFKNIK